MMWLLETILRKLNAVQDTANYTASRVDHAIHLIHKRDASGLKLVVGIVIDSQGKLQIMSQTNQITLVNAADPSVATRYLGVLDLANGTTVPTITSSDPTKLAVVVGAVNGTQVPFGLYPVGTSAETNDAVTVTISLAGQPDITLDFVISGQPVPPPETDSLDPSSQVGAVPASPV